MVILRLVSKPFIDNIVGNRFQSGFEYSSYILGNSLSVRGVFIYKYTTLK